MKTCDAFAHGNARQKLGTSGSVYSVLRYMDGGSAGLAIFNLESYDTTASVDVPSQLRGHNVIDCVTKSSESSSLGSTYTVRIPGLGFKMIATQAAQSMQFV